MRSVRFDSFDSVLSLQVWCLPISTNANRQKQLSNFCQWYFLLLANAAGGKLVQTTVPVESCTVGLSLLDLLKEEIWFLILYLLRLNKIWNAVFGLFDRLLRDCILFLCLAGCLLKLGGLGVFRVLGITATVISFGFVAHRTFRYLTHKEVIIIGEAKRRTQFVLKTIRWHVRCIRYSGRLRRNLLREIILMICRLLLVQS